MKQFSYILILCAVVSLAGSCSDETSDEKNTAGIELQEISTALGEDTEVGLGQSRAGVVSTTDPSSTPIAQRGAYGWKLDVQLYSGSTPYTPGTNTYVWNGTSSWIPQTNPITYFPNYSNQTGKFRLYATAPNTAIVTDQRDALTQLQQDQLYISTSVRPAHIVNVTLSHEESMIDFTFVRIPLSIQSVVVMIGTTLYNPYQVPGLFRYLLILPSVTTTTNPVVILTTTNGSVYKQTVNIIGNTSIGTPTYLGVNNRYIFSLTGLDLGLSPISVVDWVYGGSLAGNYVGEIAYPTFRGPALLTCTLTFSNGLTQTLTFNSQGEHTVKPVGRTIVQIEVNGNSCPANVILNQMIIDLNALIAQCVIN